VELNSMTDGVPEAPSENRPENSPEFVTVARVGEIPAGEGRSYEVGQRIVAVFRQGDTYTAIDDICPHAGASLSGGYVENGAVMCPWHAWKFCTREGTWLDNPKSSIRQDCFDVRVVGDEIQVRPAS
jgi:nitrite reductase (NADH) small subunit